MNDLFQSNIGFLNEMIKETKKLLRHTHDPKERKEIQVYLKSVRELKKLLIRYELGNWSPLN